MPSINRGSELLRAVHEEALEQGRKEGEHTALMVAIHTVDLLLAHSSTLDEFREKWGLTKALSEEFPL